MAARARQDHNALGHVGLVGALLAIAGPAQAVVVGYQTALQVACYGNDDLVVAQVMDAKLRPCDPYSSCLSRFIEVKTVVQEVITPSSGGIAVGDTLNATILAPDFALDAKGARANGALPLPAAADLSDTFLKSSLVGRALALTMDRPTRTLRPGLPAEVDSLLQSRAYMSDEVPWLRTTWASRACAKERSIPEDLERKLRRK